MTIALLSDIHSNIEALDAVIEALPNVDQVMVLGDIVGYGPDPNAVIDRLREIKAMPVLGNHDYVMLDPSMLDWFNPHAAAAARWTRGVLTPPRTSSRPTRGCAPGGYGWPRSRPR